MSEEMYYLQTSRDEREEYEREARIRNDLESAFIYTGYDIWLEEIEKNKSQED